jgi:uncharacterized Fe-S cluster protein YjdI
MPSAWPQRSHGIISDSWKKIPQEWLHVLALQRDVLRSQVDRGLPEGLEPTNLCVWLRGEMARGAVRDADAVWLSFSGQPGLSLRCRILEKQGDSIPESMEICPSIMIPIYINVFNRLTTTKKLADQCRRFKNSEIILIDNNSDWQPLLDWYQKDCPFDVVRLTVNAGHHAPWLVIESGSDFEKKWGSKNYVVTDCDLDIRDCPDNALEILKKPFRWPEPIHKSGLSLIIKDLPEWQRDAVAWESQFWEKKHHRDDLFFQAPIDTTFAIYPSQISHEKAKMIHSDKCVRCSPPYSARHMPWYIDTENMDDENEHYYRSCLSSSTWRPLPGKRGLSQC